MLLSRRACNQRLREHRQTELVREVIPLCNKIGAAVQRKGSIQGIRPAGDGRVPRPRLA